MDKFNTELPVIDATFEVLQKRMGFDMSKKTHMVIGVKENTRDNNGDTIAVIMTLNPLPGGVPVFEVVYNRIDIQDFAKERGINFRAMSADKNSIVMLFNYLFNTKLTVDDFGTYIENGRTYMNFDNNLMFKGNLMIRVV